MFIIVRNRKNPETGVVRKRVWTAKGWDVYGCDTEAKGYRHHANAMKQARKLVKQVLAFSDEITIEEI